MTQLKFEIYIIIVDITLSFLLGSKNKNKFSEIDIFRLQFLLIKLWEVILNSVSCNSYTMGCPPVRGDNPRALASGLSYVQVDKHVIAILYHLHQCRSCTSSDISC